MYCFYLVEINQNNSKIVVDEVVFLITENVSFERYGRAIGYGRTREEALQNANLYVKAGVIENVV